MVTPATLVVVMKKKVCKQNQSWIGTDSQFASYPTPNKPKIQVMKNKIVVGFYRQWYVLSFIEQDLIKYSVDKKPKRRINHEYFKIEHFDSLYFLT